MARYLFGWFIAIAMIMIMSLTVLGGLAKPKAEDFKYTIWIGVSGLYANEYAVSGGAISFKNTKGKLIQSSQWEVREN